MHLTRYINVGILYGIKNDLVRIGEQMRDVPLLANAYLEVIDGRITGFGTMEEMNNGIPFEGKVVDVKGKTLLPLFIDCHSHLVFAENREQEFSDRLHGMTYQQIAERGGGILNSAAKLSEMTEDDLFHRAMGRLEKVIETGTGAIEIKSGYGLTLEAELKMLRVIRKLQKHSPIPVYATFLGAHAIPAEFDGKSSEYVSYVINEILPKVAEEKLATSIDVFCEKGYFELEDTQRIIEAGKLYDLKARIHVNQFNSFGGIKIAADAGANSVEHLEVITEEDIEVLKQSEMFAVGLPNCSFFLSIPYMDGRRLIDESVRVVLASDYNPGSAPSGNLCFTFSLACLKMGMVPEEAFNSLTINAAHCLEVDENIGSISVGKQANFMLLAEGSTLASLAYNFSNSLIEEVWINGEPYSRM